MLIDDNYYCKITYSMFSHLDMDDGRGDKLAMLRMSIVGDGAELCTDELRSGTLILNRQYLRRSLWA
jgi:hypothetical protein